MLCKLFFVLLNPLKRIGLIAMKFSVNFWGKYHDQISSDLKDFVFEQYLSKDTIFIYCDASASREHGQVAIACYLMGKTNSVVKYQVVNTGMHPSKIQIGELRAIIFALNIFEKYIFFTPERIVIYTDISEIKDILNEEIVFKVEELRKNQRKLIKTLTQKMERNPDLSITIEYLDRDRKKHNPFHKAAHNAALKLLRSLK